ncbi:MAG: sulfatase [Candidatus Brocadiia bacterium]
MSRPNILYIHSHDTGRYVRPHGWAGPTPRIQQLAEEGVVFRQAFCTNPTCSPSRASLLTGRWPHNNGMVGLAHRGFRLNDYGHHVVRTLREAGYYSALSGAQHIIPDDERETIGYDAGLGAPGPKHIDAENLAAGWLRDGPPEPFFLSVGFHETHRTFPEPACDCPETDPRYVRPPEPLPDAAETRGDMAAFNTKARVLDRKMGVVFDALNDAGLRENTLVICTTDHGLAFPRMKCNLEDSGIGVMLIARGPGFPAGGAVDGMVSHVDIFPTLCDYLGIEPPDWLQGVSFMPLVRGEAEQVREEVFAEVNYHAAYEPMRCVRTPRWKYIRRFYDRESPVLPNCDDSPSKELWLRDGWDQMAPPQEALYDLVFDPHETDNLCGDPRAADALTDMRARLERWMVETEDPLLEGDVPAPRGAQVNDPDARSHREPPMTI